MIKNINHTDTLIEFIEISTPIHPIITPKVKEPASPRKIRPEKIFIKKTLK